MDVGPPNCHLEAGDDNGKCTSIVTLVEIIIYTTIYSYSGLLTAPKKTGGSGGRHARQYKLMHIDRYIRINNYIYKYILVVPPASRAEKKAGGLGAGTPPSIRKNAVLSLYSYT